MATLTSTVEFRNALLNSTDDVNALFAGGALTIRTGPGPGASVPASGVLLATCPVGAAQWLPAAAGSRLLSAMLVDTSAAASGIAEHFRLSSADGVHVIEGDVTGLVGGGAMELLSTSIGATQRIELSECRITLAAPVAFTFAFSSAFH
jgi:hypothetical protein